jgi:hypothetical protein
VQNEQSSSRNWCGHQQQNDQDGCGGDHPQVPSPLYKKVVFSSMRVKAHDEIGCQIGDEVADVESRPLSRTKRWAVESVVKREVRTADQGRRRISHDPA